MKRPRTLSATFVDRVSQPGFYGDGRGGHGLSMLVKRMASTGRVSKSWCQRIRLGGKPRNIGLGAFPLISLANAREAGRENARLARADKHPREHAITFAAAAAKVIEIHRPSWTPARSEQDWTRTFREYAFSVFGHKRVDRITTADVLECLIPIWQAKHSTATKLRGRIGAVMDWAESHGHRSERNPVGKKAIHRGPARARADGEEPSRTPLRRGRGRDRPGVRLAGVGRHEALLRVHRPDRGAKRRSPGVVWEENDFEARTWTVPTGRMKARKEHRVPLSGRAVEVLRKAEAGTGGGSGLVFPSRSGKALNDVTLSKLLRELGVAAVPYGFHSLPTNEETLRAHPPSWPH